MVSWQERNHMQCQRKGVHFQDSHSGYHGFVNLHRVESVVRSFPARCKKRLCLNM